MNWFKLYLNEVLETQNKKISCVYGILMSMFKKNTYKYNFAVKVDYRENVLCCKDCYYFHLEK